VTLALGATSVRYGSAVGFTVRASRGTSGTGSVDAGSPVALRFRASGSTAWTTVRTGVTGAGGVWTGTITGVRLGYFKAVRLPSPNGVGSIPSAYRTLAVTFAPTISVSATSARHGRSIRVTARVRPSAQAARRNARVEIYTGGHWVFSRYVRLSSAGNATFYERRSTAGTRKIRLRLTSGKGYGTGASSTLTLRWY
jgi:hypothetical protein